jgi:hypothetical protein
MLHTFVSVKFYVFNMLFVSNFELLFSLSDVGTVAFQLI